ncbi:MAG: hypothetical protein IPG59_00260 [Candidatus Melainabacteria bacterium]|nr:MAG: hypothetical protein IPG59_00260 [Candidatus Melainabacteria bacterium]
MNGRLISLLLIVVIAIGGTYLFRKDQENKRIVQEQEMMRKVPNNVKSKTVTEIVNQTRSVYPATSKTLLTDMARAVAGRVDPFAPTTTTVQRIKTTIEKETKISKVPPPPNGALNLENEMSLPPEPKVSWSDTVKTSELPGPPDKPILANRVRLNAIFDNNIVLDLIDPDLRRALGMRKFITLKEGDNLTVDGETTHVAKVDDDYCLLTEGSSRRRLVLTPIR